MIRQYNLKKTGYGRPSHSEAHPIGVDETSKCRGHDDISLFMGWAKQKAIFVGRGEGNGNRVGVQGDFRTRERSGRGQARTPAGREKGPVL
jgi:hypothetical protein